MLSLNCPAQQRPTAPPQEQGADDDGIIETVRLGGEGTKPEPQQGVTQEGIEILVPEEEATDSPEAPDKAKKDTTAPMHEKDVVRDPSVHDPSRVAHALTRADARTMSLTIPAPRGMITDRTGAALAYSEVAYQPSILFGQQQDESDEHILSIARQVIADYEALGIEILEKTDKQLLNHYHNRCWLPLSIGKIMRREQIAPLKEQLQAIPNSQLTALYIRRYPEKATAGHILGYTGTKAKLPIGPINHKDPIFARQEGRSGLEKSFDQQLQGRDGVWRLMFNEKGKKILDELQVSPKPGGTLVTTLNLVWQKAAEQALRENTEGRGAFVMIDCHTGEIVVMASVPNFDPNVFIPFITQDEYDKLRNDKDTPLVSRAFAGVYPPASTFKTITIAAALRYNIIKENTYIYCPYSVRIGGHEFRNHSSFEGSINCVTALVLSNNPFLYQIAATNENKLGAARLCEVARRMGLGTRSGVPIADKSGNVPDENWMYRSYGRGFMAGDAANMAIGQGPLLATPLQIAHAMTSIANGRYLPKLQLVRQIHDKDGNVIYQFNPEVQSNLSDMEEAFAVVRKGMSGVVNGGTGRRATLSYVENAGKTGTAQWGKPSDDCRLAWFAGFLPASNPRYAYVALYEGSPGQRISGGHMAATIVKSFFESIRPSLEESLKEDPFVINLETGRIDIDTSVYTQEELEAARAAAEHMEQDHIRREEEIRQREEDADRRNSTDNWGSGRRRR